MKLAVFGDVHGNLAALEATLEDAERQAADSFVCLGDVASFGPQPCETLLQVQALECPVVMCNTDDGLLQPHVLEANATELQIIFADLEHWCAERLTDEDRAFIRTFQKTVRLELGDLPTLCFHGSPASYNDEILATTPNETLAELFQERAPLMFGGHTHIPLVRRFQNVLFVNPGSVGIPYERLPGGGVRNPAWAEYALVETVEGQPSITLRRVPYDVTPVLNAAGSSGMPHSAWWSADWLC